MYLPDTYMSVSVGIVDIPIKSQFHTILQTTAHDFNSQWLVHNHITLQNRSQKTKIVELPIIANMQISIITVPTYSCYMYLISYVSRIKHK